MKKFTVRLCDDFLNVEAENEQEAERIVKTKIKEQIELELKQDDCEYSKFSLGLVAWEAGK